LQIRDDLIGKQLACSACGAARIAARCSGARRGAATRRIEIRTQCVLTGRDAGDRELSGGISLRRGRRTEIEGIGWRRQSGK